MNKPKAIAILIISVLIAAWGVLPARSAAAQLPFTEEEQEYIRGAKTLKAVSLSGVAPIQYYDAKGEVRGISRAVMDTISDMTGLPLHIICMIP